MSAALQRSSRWQGSISQLQRQTVGLRQIPRSGVSHVTAEHRIYTVKPTTGVSDNMPLAKVQDLLQRKLGPLINGACRQSFPQGHRRILPDPCAPGFAALLAVLNTSHIHLVCPDTQASALVAVDNTLSLGAVHPLTLLFRQIPLELSGIGFPEAILQLAGYEVLTEGPLLSPASGSVRLVQYGPGTDKASQQPDDASKSSPRQMTLTFSTFLRGSSSGEVSWISSPRWRETPSLASRGRPSTGIHRLLRTSRIIWTSGTSGRRRRKWRLSGSRQSRRGMSGGTLARRGAVPLRPSLRRLPMTW